MKGESQLTRRLRNGAALQQTDIDRLEMISGETEFFSAQTDLIRQADRPFHVHVVTEGVACRYKLLSDGRRAIVALMLPGDFCDLHVTILGRMDHSVGTLVDSRIARLSAREVSEMLEGFPAISRACWWSTLVDEAVLREWLVNVGRRSSEEHLAHLLCELYTRLSAVGLTTDHHFQLPFTQVILADVLGISTVHVQRVLRRLREAGLIVFQDRMIELPDYKALIELGDFDPGYLHLGPSSGA